MLPPARHQARWVTRGEDTAGPATGLLRDTGQWRGHKSEPDPTYTKHPESENLRRGGRVGVGVAAKGAVISVQRRRSLKSVVVVV